MNKQPEALRLANQVHCGDDKCKCSLNQAADELRRLHKVEKHAEWLSDEISELKILDASRLHSLQVAGEMYESLQEKNSELVKVMEQALKALCIADFHVHHQEIIGAITDLQNALKGTT